MKLKHVHIDLYKRSQVKPGRIKECDNDLFTGAGFTLDYKGERFIYTCLYVYCIRIFVWIDLDFIRVDCIVFWLFLFLTPADRSQFFGEFSVTSDEHFRDEWKY